MLEDFDPLGLKNTTGIMKSIVEKSLDGFGAVLSKVCEPAAEEFGLMLRDKVSNWREKNAKAVLTKTLELIDDKKEEGLAEQRFNHLMPILEHIPTEDDPLLQDMWAHLLATSLTDGSERKIYSRILMQLDSDDALVFQRMHLDIFNEIEEWESQKEARWKRFVQVSNDKNDFHYTRDKTEEELKENFMRIDKRPDEFYQVEAWKYDSISVLNLMSLNLIEHPDKTYSKEVKVEQYEAYSRGTEVIEFDTIDKDYLIITELGKNLFDMASSLKYPKPVELWSS